MFVLSTSTSLLLLLRFVDILPLARPYSAVFFMAFSVAWRYMMFSTGAPLLRRFLNMKVWLDDSTPVFIACNVSSDGWFSRYDRLLGDETKLCS